MSPAISPRAAAPTISLRELQNSISKPAIASASLRSFSTPASRMSPPIPLAGSLAMRSGSSQSQAPATGFLSSLRRDASNVQRNPVTLSQTAAMAGAQSKGSQPFWDSRNSRLAESTANTAWIGADSGKVNEFAGRLLRNAGGIEVFNTFQSAHNRANNYVEATSTPASIFDSNRFYPLQSGQRGEGSVYVIMPQNDFNVDVEIPPQFTPVETLIP
jgi:hypothetical protein